MCDRVRCNKNGEPVIEDCEDCLIIPDGPDPSMYSQKCQVDKFSSRACELGTKGCNIRHNTYPDMIKPSGRDHAAD